MFKPNASGKVELHQFMLKCSCFNNWNQAFLFRNALFTRTYVEAMRLKKSFFEKRKVFKEYLKELTEAAYDGQKQGAGSRELEHGVRKSATDR